MSNLARRTIFTICWLLIFWGMTQRPAMAQPSISLSDGAYISLITIYPGNQAHNLFGHSALRVRDPYHGFDLLYNYGTFQFDYKFLPKFIYGRLDYMLWASDIRRELQRYQNDGRSIIEQFIALDQDQKQAAFDFLQVNARKENRVYQYDFLFDNCSTRIRDVFEHILGDNLSFSEAAGPRQSFRHLLDPYIQSRPFLDAGIDMALAIPTDAIATSREEMFLPINLMEAFDGATVVIDGKTVPFVSNTVDLYRNEKTITTDKPPTLYVVMWLIFIMALWVSNGTSPRAIWARKWFDRFLYGFSGFAGLLALFLWLVAIHEVTNYNWNLLWAWPTHLVALWSLAKSPTWLKPYMRVTAIVLFITILGWFFWPQEMHTAYIPLLMAIAVRSIWWGWKNDETANTEAAKAPAVT